MREFSTWFVICLLVGAALIASQLDMASVFDRMDGEQISWSNGLHKFGLRYHGKITPSDDGRDILQMSPDGYLSLSEGGFLRAGRRLQLRPHADGTIERKFFLNGRAEPYEPDGKAWLAEIMPELLRRTAFAADVRVEKILRAGGVTAVLAEISAIESDYVKRIYFSTLFNQATPDGQVFAQALAQAGEQISSDYELRQLLTSTVDRAIPDAAARSAYFDAAATIDSDYELASLLITIAETQTLDSTIRDAYFATLKTIDSDYEFRRVLSAVVARASDPAILSAMLESLSLVDSDYEAAEFLTSFARLRPQGELRDSYLDAAGRLSSEYERNRALAALVGSERR